MRESTRASMWRVSASVHREPASGKAPARQPASADAPAPHLGLSRHEPKPANASHKGNGSSARPRQITYTSTALSPEPSAFDRAVSARMQKQSIHAHTTTDSPPRAANPPPTHYNRVPYLASPYLPLPLLAACCLPEARHALTSDGTPLHTNCPTSLCTVTRRR